MDADTGSRLTITLIPTTTNRSRSVTITNLYAPNRKQTILLRAHRLVPKKQFYHKLTNWYLNQHIANHIIGGGGFYTTVIEHEDRKQRKDRKGSQPQQTTAIDQTTAFGTSRLRPTNMPARYLETTPSRLTRIYPLLTRTKRVF